jgi:CheY-like chemotaxis protein
MTETQNTTASLEGKKVMWVEDDNFLSGLIGKKLANEKAILFHATNGEDAVAMVEKEMPDVLLLDILLPGMTGLQVLQKIKSNPVTKDIPVLLLSNLGQKADIDKGAQLGAEKFLIKATLSLDEIMTEVKRVVAKK